MDDLIRRLEGNLGRVRARIDNAAGRAGRDPSRVRLVAITKYVDPRGARALVAAGCRVLGENRPQSLWEKADSLNDLPVEWHLVGPLQRNKVRRTLPLTACVHSVDSVRLLEEINACAESLGKVQDVLLEVNVSGDSAKHGFHPRALAGIVGELTRFPRLAARGLMTMASLNHPGDAARVDFRALRDLRDFLNRKPPPTGPLVELSMGMSDDFETAVEEGATMVRIGSALFEGLSGG
ncbi:MAG: YggS family pyridoxal phosphate-dependent enzyme [Planctomycetes bacterium]|nr:YggS family pyridoxal phosphate-dependent enzyme [Planctomycetota bacterium]